MSFRLNFCPIVLGDGSDCAGEPGEDTPYGLCDVHFEKIAYMFHKPEQFPRPMRCEYCRSLAVSEFRYTGVWFCASCNKRSELAPTFAADDRVFGGMAPVEVVSSGPPAVEVVYYIRWADRIKIGTTRHLHTRMKQLYHDELLAVELGGVDRERYRHQQFRECRLPNQREWFTLSPKLVAHVNDLRKENGPPMKAVARWGIANAA